MPDADQPAESLQASVQGPLRPSILSPWVTAAYGLFVGVYLGLAVIPSSSSRLDQLDRPEESLERLVSRDLDLRDALHRAADWKRALYVAFAGPEDTLGDAIAWYDELVSAGPAPLPQLHWVILLVAEIRSELTPGWFADVLIVRVAAAMGDRAVQDKAEAAIVARGEALLDRWISLILGQLVLLALGAVVLGRLLTRRLPVLVGDVPLPPLWSQQDGHGLFVPGVFGFLRIGLAANLLLPKESLFTGISTLVG